MSLDEPVLVAGLGITGRAVVVALRAHGVEVVALDDRPTDAVRAFAASAGIQLVEAPDDDTVAALVQSAGTVVPTPGMPDHHEVIITAAATRTPVRSEFDLAQMWDTRPIVAVTGTDGKTTVTTMVALMLDAAGIPNALAGNNDTPLVAAIDDPDPQLFVVEASSFRIGHSATFAPLVATWLNFAPDHLEVHANLDAYEEAKAKIFDHQPPEGVAITNADDPVVTRHRGRGPARNITFAADGGDYRVVDGALVTDVGEPIIPVAELRRRAPHDIANALAAAATARAAGASIEAIASVLGSFAGLPHRLELVDERAGIRFVDDSKATSPHAVITAVRSEPRVVLIAGGRNKGLDLGELAEVSDRVVHVVAIGEATAEIRAAFEPVGVPVTEATSMLEAVSIAARHATPGDTVLLSPGCGSHDWYTNFAERGDDFANAVRIHLTEAPTS